MLSRSKNAPLAVAYHIATTEAWDMQRQSAQLRVLHTVLSQNVERLYCVRLSFNYLNIRISTLFSAWTYPPPILQEFSICGHWTLVEGEEIPAIELLQDAPALRHLDLQLRYTIWTDLPFSRDLTHLEIHNARNTGFCPVTGEFLASLGRMPHLQVLGLYSALPGAKEYESSPVSLPELRKLTIHDHTRDIGYFFQITRVPNLASIHIVFSDFEEEEIITDQVFDALRDLQVSIGCLPEPQTTVDTARVSDTSLELSFTPSPQTEKFFPNLTVSDCLTPTIGSRTPITIHDYLEFFSPLFEFATLNALEVEQTTLNALPKAAWAFFGSLPNLRTVTLQATPLGTFLDVLEAKPDPILPHGPKALYFPALSSLRFLSLDLEEEDYEVNMQEFTGRLINILKRHVRRGYPLSELHIENPRHFNGPEVAGLCMAVPSLRVVWDGYEACSSDDGNSDFGSDDDWQGGDGDG